MSDIRVNNITNRGGNGGPVIAGITTVSSNTFMVVPSGTTEARSAGSGRGVITSGSTPSSMIADMEYVNIASTGDAQDFGDLQVATHFPSSSASSTRGLNVGGFSPTGGVNYNNLIEYITISSQGGSFDFGDLRTMHYAGTGFSNETRGLHAGGQRASSTYNTFAEYITITTNGVGSALIEFCTIATLGDFTKFGEMSVIKHMSDGGFSSNTRGIFAGGYSPTLTALQNSMESVEIATLGNGVDFGDLNNTTQQLSSTSNKILVECFVVTGGQADGFIAFKTFRDSTAIGIGTAGTGNQINASSSTAFGNASTHQFGVKPAAWNFLDSPSSTSSLTYKVQWASTYLSRTMYINRSYTTADSSYVAITISTITVKEVAA